LRREINHEGVPVIKAGGTQARVQRDLKGEGAGLGYAEVEAQVEGEGEGAKW
jgi:hypothetical protein